MTTTPSQTQATLMQDALKLHEQHKGKIRVVSAIPLTAKRDLSLCYTPGVAEPCREIAKNPENAYKYTIKGHTVAVVSDGSAVLGLGNIGAGGAIPVMEGKAMLFKELGGIDAFPICLSIQDVQTTITTIKNIAPVFGGINIEDIKAPECFAIEAALQDLGIPVMHDDQHATAIVVVAGLLNALKIIGKQKDKVTIVVNGAGASASGVTRLLLDDGFKHITLCDTKGIIYEGRANLDDSKRSLALITNRSKKSGTLTDAVKGADIFIGLSVKDALTPAMASSMAKNSIIMAMANPDPEILPDAAKKAGAAIVATGRSDFTNQVNNVLAFPGVFKGALEVRATRITTAMKLAAAHALADMVPQPHAEMILPEALDKTVAPTIAAAVAKAWKEHKP